MTALAIMQLLPKFGALNPVLTTQQQMNEILKKKYLDIQSSALQLLE